MATENGQGPEAAAKGLLVAWEGWLLTSLTQVGAVFWIWRLSLWSCLAAVERSVAGFANVRCFGV